MASTMASATAASAAASTTMNSATTCPAMAPWTKWANAAKFRAAALRISSTPIRMATALRRVLTVYRPRANSTAETTR